MPQILDITNSKSVPAYINIVSIDENVSYFLATNKEIRAWLKKVLMLKFMNDMALADHLWLRKEIIQEVVRLKNN